MCKNSRKSPLATHAGLRNGLRSEFARWHVVRQRHGPIARWPGAQPVAFDGEPYQTLLCSWVQFSGPTSRPAFGWVNASLYIKPNVCVCVCFFDPYIRPQFWADLHEIWHVASLCLPDGHGWSPLEPTGSRSAHRLYAAANQWPVVDIWLAGRKTGCVRKLGTSEPLLASTAKARGVTERRRRENER